MYPRFCKPLPAHRHLSQPSARRPTTGSLWFAGYYPASPAPLRRDPTEAGPSRLAPSRTLAWPAPLLETAGRLLPYPFTPYQLCQSKAAGLLSVAVVVRCPLPDTRPHLLFHGATFRPEGRVLRDGRESGSSSTGARPAATAASTPTLSFYTELSMTIVNLPRTEGIVPRRPRAVKFGAE